MAALNTIPFAAQNAQEVEALVHNLIASTKKGAQGEKKGFSCKKSDFEVESSPSKISVTSWKFQDWDYKRDDLPTYARGLFISKNEQGQPEIAIRGYDKFFNQEEVNDTRWRNIENNTSGPYELSLKENGCIIFISGLHDGTLLVTSKHSTGSGANAQLSHSKAGERWVDKHLAIVGKTRAELAHELRRRNATAVAELCDDEFEEHILAYGKEDAGLYIHGINLNLPEFVTYSGPQVHAFADAWGFKKTDFLVIDDIHQTKTFLEGVAETGHYNGRDIEGFVIRCKSQKAAGGKKSDWFFKYKFEEPYLMYRQWRECTKAVIAGKPPRYRKHEKITQEYLLYAKQMIAQNPSLAKEYNANHGIIKLRNDFLKEKNLKGSDIIRQEYAESGGALEETSKDVILVPIATLGCGKTTIAVALRHLFNWGHVQNDNIVGKARPPRFTKEVLNQLSDAPVVFADRNNAGKHERRQILEDVHQTHPHIRLVALNFIHTPETINKIRQVTQQRVFERGDNHQTIQAASDQKKVLGIMENFIQRFEPLNTDASPDDGFDAVVDLDPTADSRQNLESVISSLSSQFPKLFPNLPTSEDLDEAIEVAIGHYKPDVRHTISDRGPPKTNQQKKATQQNTKKPRPLEYICVDLPKEEIQNLLESAFASITDDKANFFTQLQQTHRVQPAFHVTLMHRASSKAHPELWQKFTALHTEAGDATKIGDCNILLESIVWDNRIMAIVARIATEGWTCINDIAHITIGTKIENIKPKESNDMLRRWNEQGVGEQTGISEIPISGRLILAGTVRGHLSR